MANGVSGTTGFIWRHSHGCNLGHFRGGWRNKPLIVIGRWAYVPFTPSSPMDEFTVLPIQIFNWISRPQHEFTINKNAQNNHSINYYVHNEWYSCIFQEQMAKKNKLVE